MLAILRKIIKNPVEVVAILAFVPLFIEYPGISIANLFILAALVLAYFTYLSPDRRLRISSPLILIGSLLIYFFTANANFSFVFVALTVGIIALLVYLSMSHTLATDQVKKISRIFVAGLAIMILLPLTFKVCLNYLVHKEVALSRSNSAQIETHINEDNNSVKEIVSALDTDPFIIDLLEKREYANLSEYCQNIMIAKSLDYLTITDSENKVVARAHRPKAIGDDYSKIIAEVKDTKEINGIYYENDKAFVATLLPVKKQDQPKIGSIIGGHFINDAYLTKYLPDNGGAALYSQLTLYSAASKSPILSAFILSAKDKTKLDDNIYNIYRYQDTNILLTSYTLAGGAGKLLLYYPLDLRQKAFEINLVVFLILIMLIHLIYKIKDKRDTAEAFSVKIFGHKNSSISLRSVITHILEYLLFAIILSLLWWRTSDAFYQYGFTTTPIVADNIEPKLSITPGLQLVAPSYLKVGDTAEVKYQINDLKSSPANTQLLVKFDQAILTGTGIDYTSGACQKVYDKTIDNDEGLISFSCELKDNLNLTGGAVAVANFKFETKAAGVANVAIDENYSLATNPEGRSNKVVETFPVGENMIIN